VSQDLGNGTLLSEIFANGPPITDSQEQIPAKNCFFWPIRNVFWFCRNYIPAKCKNIVNGTIREKFW